MREAELFVLADQHFSEVVGHVAGKWDTKVPATPEWTVKELVHHVTQNNVALTEVLTGQKTSTKDVTDAAGAWVESAEVAEDAANETTDSNKQAALPPLFKTAGEALSLHTADRLIHTWDLAGAIGAETKLDDGLVQAVYDFIYPRIDDLRALGIFGPEVAVEDDATLQERLLALTGRDPGTEHREDPDSSSRIEEIHRSS